MNEIKDRINNLRRKVLVHSYIYYREGTSIIDDQTFDKWSQELVKIQKEHPEDLDGCVYPEDFEGFDGTTGFDLSRDSWVERTANRLLKQAGQNR